MSNRAARSLHWMPVLLLVIGIAPRDTAAVGQADEKLPSLQYVLVSSQETKEGEPGDFTDEVQILDGALLRRHIVFRKAPAPGKPVSEVYNEFTEIQDAIQGKKIVLYEQKKECAVVTHEIRVYPSGEKRRVEIVPWPEADFGQYLRRGQPQFAKKLPARIIDGKTAIGLLEVNRIGSDTLTTTWWIDAKTQLPIRIDSQVTATSGKVTHTAAYKDIVFGAPLDRALFSVAPPAGYKVVVDEGLVAGDDKGTTTK
ncbi:MAG: hypothetical protein AB7O59_18660 [Pirellulales bacterium]